MFGILVAAIFGGIVVLSGAYGLHVAGILKLPTEASIETRQLLAQSASRISDLESKLEDVAASARTSGADSALVDGLSSRIGTVETKIADIANSAGDAAVTDFGPDITALKSELKAVRGDVESITSVPAIPAGSDQSGLGELQERLATLETTVAAFQPASGSLTELTGTVDTLTTSVSDLGSRVQGVEGSTKAAQSAVAETSTSLKTLADSQTRLSETVGTLSSELQSTSKTDAAAVAEVRSEIDVVSTRLTSLEATMGDATAREMAARALSVSALKSAVDSGRSYETELAAVKAGLPEGTDLAALQAHAKDGIAPVSVLIAEFPAVARNIHGTFSEPDRSVGLLDSFIAGAKSIVSVRGPGDADGTGPEASLRRMENAVSKGDLSSGLADYETLPDVAKQAGADWAARAKARVSVDQLTEAASKEVLSALGRKDS